MGADLKAKLDNANICPIPGNGGDDEAPAEGEEAGGEGDGDDGGNESNELKDLEDKLAEMNAKLDEMNAKLDNFENQNQQQPSSQNICPTADDNPPSDTPCPCKTCKPCIPCKPCKPCKPANPPSDPDCPCKNGGVCKKLDEYQAECNCTPQFTGQFCTEPKSETPVLESRSSKGKQKPFKWPPAPSSTTAN